MYNKTVFGVIGRFISIAILVVASGHLLAQEIRSEFANDNFSKLSEEKKKITYAAIDKALKKSMEEAEAEIKERGGLRPFAYVLNAASEGQFIRVTEEQKNIKPSKVLAGIQRAIDRSALKGNLSASLLYMTFPSPKELGEDVVDKMEEKIGDKITDARFLVVELQHIAGLGVLITVPYWESNGEWVFGEPQRKNIPAQLFNFVHSHRKKAMEKKNSSG